MPKQEGQKSKLLALLRIFEQQTDENHLLNVPQLVELLEAQGIRCERACRMRWCCDQRAAYPRRHWCQ